MEEAGWLGQKPEEPAQIAQAAAEDAAAAAVRAHYWTKCAGLGRRQKHRQKGPGTRPRLGCPGDTLLVLKNPFCVLRQARALREQHKHMQQRWLWLFRAVRAATAVLFVWWFLLLSSFQIDSGLRLLMCLGSFPLAYVLASYVVRYYLLWQKRPLNDGRFC